MELLIVRHAEAVDEAPGLGDAGRWLTAKGRRVTRKIGRWLCDRAKGAPPDHERRPVAIWTSPLVRAVQTADILAEALDLDGELRACAELSPVHDPRDVLRRLSELETQGPLALVGHEPGLSVLAKTLLGDVPWPGFKKSAVLGVRWSKTGLARFRFLLQPKELTLVTDLAALADPTD